MEKVHFQIEILLVTGTTFSAGNWVGKQDDPPGRQLSELERLQEACWNGLVKTLLPEIWVDSPSGGTLYLWEVREAQSVLTLELSEVPLPTEPDHSIRPDMLVSRQNLN
jgi:hypothetical protein